MSAIDPKKTVVTPHISSKYCTLMLRSALLATFSSMLFGCTSQPPIASIPVEIVNGNAVASARIGNQTIDVIVDTGGFGGIAISSDDLSRLDVDFTGKLIERTDSAGDAFESPSFIVPELVLGGHKFRAVAGFERIGSASGFAGGEPLSVVGRGLLHKYTVIVDYPNEEIRMYSAESGASVCGVSHGHLTLDEDGHFLLSVETDGGQMLALMDTGATYSFVQRRLIAERKLETVEDFYTTSTLRVGDRELGPLEMVVLPIDGAPEIDAFVGANFFSRHTVCFDCAGRTVSFFD